MDRDVLRVQPNVHSELGPDEYRIAFSTKSANEVEGYLDWINHDMTFRHVRGEWELSEYGRGVIN